MLSSCDFNHCRLHWIHTLHEQDIHAIENDLHDRFRLSDGLQFGDIGLFDGLDSILSLSQVRQSLLELLVSLISFDLNLGALSLTSFSDTIDLFSLDVSFLVLLVKFLEQLVRSLSGSVKFRIFFLEDNLHRLNISGGLGEFLETLCNVLLLLINSLILGRVQLLVSLDEGEIGLGRHIYVSTHLREVGSANLIDHLVDLTHVDGQLLLCLRIAVNLEVVNELGGDGDERLLRPWEEPIDGAATEDSGEFLGTLSELYVDGGEGQDHVQVVLHTVQEVVPEDGGGRVLTLLSNLLHVDVLALDGNEILVFFSEETWDLTGGKHGVDSFEEGFRLDFSVGHEEADSSTLRSSLLVKQFDIVEEILEIV